MVPLAYSRDDAVEAQVDSHRAAAFVVVRDVGPRVQRGAASARGSTFGGSAMARIKLAEKGSEGLSKTLPRPLREVADFADGSGSIIRHRMTLPPEGTK